MSDIHPHWQSTKQDAPRDPDAKQVSIQPEGRTSKSRSRQDQMYKKFLYTGTSLSLVLITFLGGVTYLRAQLSTEPEQQEQVTVPPIPQLPSPTPTPTPTPTPNPTPTPTPSPSPSPSPNPSPAPTLPVQSATPTVDPWATNALKINRNIGVPSLAPTAQIPVHTIRQAQQRVHSAAPPARVQPATGPALWVFGLMTVALLPWTLRKRAQ